jgi:hypothetical protein
MATQKEMVAALQVVVGPVGEAYASMDPNYPVEGDSLVSALYEAAYEVALPLIKGSAIETARALGIKCYQGAGR